VAYGQNYPNQQCGIDGPSYQHVDLRARRGARWLRRGGAAAREADISATMAAKHVQTLEARLGSRLLNRTTRRQSLTEVGRIYYDRCKRLLAEVDAVDSSMSQLQAAPRGTLRITASVTFGTRRLAPALAADLLC
jgi:DNA-binding transcriptional LysR family regulator